MTDLPHLLHGFANGKLDLATHRAECSSTQARTFTVRDVTTLISAFGQGRGMPPARLWRAPGVSR